MKNKPGTIILLKQAIAKCDTSIKANTGQSNPQLIQILIQAKAKREAYQDVLEALQGDNSMLRAGGSASR